MNSLKSSVINYGIESLLASENLNHFYDSSLNTPDMTDKDRLKLCGYLPFYPVGTSRQDDRISTYIPMGDHETDFTMHMGLLVSESKIVENMFVIEHLPHTSDTPLPSRILSTFGSNVIYQSIRGFLIQKNTCNLKKLELMLLVGDEDNKLSAQTRSSLQGRNFISYQLMRCVKKSILLNEARVKEEAKII